MTCRNIRSFVFLFALVLFAATLPSAAAHSRYDPLFRFAKRYAAALTSCDQSRIASLYATNYMAYETDGETYGKAGLVKSLVGFCEAYSKSKFEIVKYKRVSRTQYYVVMNMLFSGFKGGKLTYAHSFTVRRTRGRRGRQIVADLKGINGERIKAALA